MKVLNYGSLNMDLTYRLPHLVRPGETLSAASFHRYCGGKGLNQSIALARAGASVLHAGKVGRDGDLLLTALWDAGVDTSAIAVGDEPSGHAVIQVDDTGENSIIICAGANAAITEREVDAAIARMSPGDWLLVQNETNAIPYILERGAAAGLRIAMNPAPMAPQVLTYPLEQVDLFFVNETEAADLTGKTGADALPEMERRWPKAIHVVTLGGDGSVCSAGGRRYTAPIRPVPVVDTTAAGDTYTGYFLAALMEGADIQRCMDRATLASAITVSRQGASPSIPTRDEVDGADL